MNKVVAPLIACLFAFAGCATSEDRKLSFFSASDYQLDYLDPAKTSTMLSTAAADKVKSIVEFADQKLEPALAMTPQPAPTVIKLAVQYGKPILVGALQERIKTSIEANNDAVVAVVGKYNVFADPELGYELIPVGDGDAAPTLTRVNASLSKAYRTLRAMRVAHKLIDVAKKDVAAMKAKPDAAALAGVGIAALSVTDLVLHSIDDAKDLLPELQNMSSEVTNQATAQPLMAVQLALPLSRLTEASADVTALPADAGALLNDVNELLTLFADTPAS